MKELVGLRMSFWVHSTDLMYFVKTIVVSFMKLLQFFSKAAAVAAVAVSTRVVSIVAAFPAALAAGFSLLLGSIDRGMSSVVPE